jgi:hypothetical protein
MSDRLFRMSFQLTLESTDRDYLSKCRKQAKHFFHAFTANVYRDSLGSFQEVSGSPIFTLTIPVDAMGTAKELNLFKQATSHFCSYHGFATSADFFDAPKSFEWEGLK